VWGVPLDWDAVFNKPAKPQSKAAQPPTTSILQTVSTSSVSTTALTTTLVSTTPATTDLTLVNAQPITNPVQTIPIKSSPISETKPVDKIETTIETLPPNVQEPKKKKTYADILITNPDHKSEHKAEPKIEYKTDHKQPEAKQLSGAQPSQPKAKQQKQKKNSGKQNKQNNKQNTDQLSTVVTQPTDKQTLPIIEHTTETTKPEVHNEIPKDLHSLTEKVNGDNKQIKEESTKPEIAVTIDTKYKEEKEVETKSIPPEKIELLHAINTTNHTPAKALKIDVPVSFGEGVIGDEEEEEVTFGYSVPKESPQGPYENIDGTNLKAIPQNAQPYYGMPGQFMFTQPYYYGTPYYVIYQPYPGLVPGDPNINPAGYTPEYEPPYEYTNQGYNPAYQFPHHYQAQYNNNDKSQRRNPQKNKQNFKTPPPDGTQTQSQNNNTPAADITPTTENTHTPNTQHQS